MLLGEVSLNWNVESLNAFWFIFSPYRDFRATENLSIQKNVEASKKIRQISSHSLEYYY